MTTTKFIRLVSLCLFVAACSSTGGVFTGGGSKGPSGRYPNDDELPKGSQGVERKIGKPYKIAGVWYYPKEQPGYDEVGVASWYGKDFHGKKTANGEYFNMNALTAAHKTLPLPTFVKVTNLQNGRSIILRVNDRGPFVGTRLIDVSRRAAQLLGFQKQGTTRVRIQAVDENGNLERVMPAPIAPPVDMVVADQLSQPTTNTKASLPNKPSATGEHHAHYIQVGAFSQRKNAEIQAGKLRKSGHRARVESITTGVSTLWRVRIGPFIEKLIAEQRLDRIVAEGFYEARIFSETVNK